MNQSDVDRTLKSVHEAALQPECWPDALTQIAQTCGGHVSVAQMAGPGGYVGLCSRGAEDMMAQYLKEDWHKRNSRMKRGIELTRAGARGLLTEERMLTREERARDPYQQEFARHHDVDCSAGMVVASHADASFVLNIERGARAGHYSDGEVATMNRLVAEVAGACSFALRLKLTTAIKMIETLGGQGEAIALLTATGQILNHTNEFERHLGERLTTREGRLHAVAASEDRELQSLINRAAAWPGGPATLGAVVLRRLHGAPLVVRCLPVAGSARDFLGLARIVLTVDDASLRPSSSADILRAIFGLTPAESRLAVRLGANETLREAADAEGIGFETARTRLKIIFNKTETNRQAELVVLVDRLSR